MKNAKKVFAMLIVLALAISMAIPVSAEVGTGTITITDAKVGEEYKVYQMAVLDFVEGESNTADDDLYAYYVEDTTGIGWYEFFVSQNSIFTLTPANTIAGRYYIGLATGVTLGDAQKAKLAKDAIKWANDNKISPAKTGTASNTTLSLSGLQFGYYAVDTTTGTVCSLNSLTSSVDIADKNSIPVVDKKINKVGDRDIVDDAADVKIGDIVEYSITIPYVPGAQNYIVTDTLSEGLTLVDKNKTAEWSSTTSITDYTKWFEISTPVSVDSSDNKTKITAENGSTKIVLVLSGEENATGAITIKYFAKVNNKAIVEDNGINEVKLQYGEKSSFTTDTVEVFPLEFSIKKVDSKDASKFLNAEFQIYKGNTLLKFEKIDGAYVYKADGSEDTLKTENGLYSIKGLDAGKYTIKETKAPAGYNLPAGTFDVTITADKENETITADYSSTVVGAVDTNGVLTIENSTGAVLPSTGATGTIIFITVGGLMVVAMGVLLVVRKRMSKVVYTR